MADVALATICAAALMGCAAIIVKSDGNSDPPVSAATEGSVWATRAASASTVIKDATVDVVSAQKGNSYKYPYIIVSISLSVCFTAGIPNHRGH